jgi:hypothetical protein
MCPHAVLSHVLAHLGVASAHMTGEEPTVSTSLLHTMHLQLYSIMLPVEINMFHLDVKAGSLLRGAPSKPY